MAGRRARLGGVAGAAAVRAGLAAPRAGCGYVDFTPSTGAALPALVSPT